MGKGSGQAEEALDCLTRVKGHGGVARRDDCEGREGKWRRVSKFCEGFERQDRAGPGEDSGEEGKGGASVRGAALGKRSFR